MNDGVDQLNAALGGRYLIEREIGRGGMAVVYLARDRRGPAWPEMGLSGQGALLLLLALLPGLPALLSATEEGDERAPAMAGG